MRQQIIGATHKQTEIWNNDSEHLISSVRSEDVGWSLLHPPPLPLTNPRNKLHKTRKIWYTIHIPEGERHYQCIVCTLYTGCTRIIDCFMYFIYELTTDNTCSCCCFVFFFSVLLFALRVICYLLFGCGACVTPFFPFVLQKDISIHGRHWYTHHTHTIGEGNMRASCTT